MIQTACIPFWNQGSFHMFPNGNHCFQIGHHHFFLVPEQESQTTRKKKLILNLNNFFSRHFKKILNGQKFGNSFIFKLPKLGENPSKTVIHFFRFLRVL